MNICVLVPHKNSPKKLSRLLSSIPQSLHVCVVDDDSDPSLLLETRAVISGFNNVEFYENNSIEKNAGTARNLGLDKCRVLPDWVIFADADDKFNTSALMKFSHFLENEQKSEVVFFNCTAIKEVDGGRSIRCDRYRALIAQWPNNSEEIASCWTVPWGRAIRYELFIKHNNLRFASRLAGNDMEFSARLAATRPKISVFREDVYVCYESNSSLTGSLTAEKSLARLKATMASNSILIRQNLPRPHYEYGFTFFYRALPLIISRGELAVIPAFFRSFLRALIANMSRSMK